MERLQIAYAGAVCAAAGCNTSTPVIDEGIDIMLTHQHEKHNSIPERSARLEVQFKATTQQPKDGWVQAKMSASRYKAFSIPKPSVDRLVVIMTLPSEQGHWVDAQAARLSIRHCAYWVNLAGGKNPQGDTVTIKAPTSQIFDDVALCKIMERIGKGGRP